MYESHPLSTVERVISDQVERKTTSLRVSNVHVSSLLAVNQVTL
jgi:hypothetical protein